MNLGIPRTVSTSLLLVVAMAFNGSMHADEPGRGATAGSSGTARAPVTLTPDYFAPRPIGNTSDEPSWITDLAIVDLDGDGLKDIVVCDARLNKICWIRQVRLGVFEETVISDTIAAPAHVAAVDFNRTGHLDLLVASMGQIPPSNERIGSVVILENDGHEHFTPHVIVDKTYRVTDVEAGDFNGDGKLDLAVGQFGYYQGQVQWLENLGNWRFKSHPLLDLPGAIHAPVAAMNGGGTLDIVALVSQDSEEVHIFEPDTPGHFGDRILYGSTNKDFGSSGLTIADLNRDGRPDIVYTNGDGFDYATPGARPWHGVQWLENRGEGNFLFHRIGDCPGAFSPVVVDLNGDGYQDVVVCSGFNNWNDPEAVSLLCFENDGTNHFVPRVLAHQPTHLIVVKAADMFNDGRIELVTGSFMFYPPYNHVSRVTLWEHKR
jgi:hypothetical protein